MGGGDDHNPFANVSWTKPFGDSFVGQLQQGNLGNAAGQAVSGIKQIGEFGNTVNKAILNPAGAANELYQDISGNKAAENRHQQDIAGVQQRDAEERARREQQAALDAENAATRQARQSESDIFTNRFTGAQGQQTLQESLQGLQDQARRLRGRKINFGG